MKIWFLIARHHRLTRSACSQSSGDIPRGSSRSYAWSIQWAYPINSVAQSHDTRSTFAAATGPSLALYLDCHPIDQQREGGGAMCRRWSPDPVVAPALWMLLMLAERSKGKKEKGKKNQFQVAPRKPSTDGVWEIYIKNMDGKEFSNVCTRWRHPNCVCQ